jgi:hypothetical protein
VPPSSPKSCRRRKNRARRVPPALTLVRNTPRIQFGTKVLQVARENFNFKLKNVAPRAIALSVDNRGEGSMADDVALEILKTI